LVFLNLLGNKAGIVIVEAHNLTPTMVDNNTRFQSVTKLVRNEALIEAGPSLDALNPNIVETDGGSLYYGTGLTTPREISVGLPFDVLGMILTAEKLRRVGGFDNIYHHIADTHAKTNDWISEDQVDERAKQVVQTLETVKSNLDLEHFFPVLSSSFDTTPEYEELVEGFGDSEEHEYVRREMADMEWYRVRHGVKIKLGWIIQASETEVGFDERRFDREYMRFHGTDLSFIYTKPGRTFDPSRPKASPYIKIASEGRLLLDPGENVVVTLERAVEAANGDKHLGGARKHLESIVRLYESLYGTFGKVPLEEKIQKIIDKCFGK